MTTNIRAFGENTKSYYEIRMSELGVNEENNLITLNDPKLIFLELRLSLNWFFQKIAREISKFSTTRLTVN